MYFLIRALALSVIVGVIGSAVWPSRTADVFHRLGGESTFDREFRHAVAEYDGLKAKVPTFWQEYEQQRQDTRGAEETLAASAAEHAKDLLRIRALHTAFETARKACDEQFVFGDTKFETNSAEAVLLPLVAQYDVEQAMLAEQHKSIGALETATSQLMAACSRAQAELPVAELKLAELRGLVRLDHVRAQSQGFIQQTEQLRQALESHAAELRDYRAKPITTLRDLRATADTADRQEALRARLAKLVAN